MKILTALLLTCLENKVYAESYSKDPKVYLEQLDLQNETINNIADSLVTENDGVKERILKAFRYVAEHTNYIAEEGEDIKTPIRTYNEGGGDCEDLSLFLIALLDRMDVWSYMFYQKTHVSVLAGPLNEEELKYFIPKNRKESVTAFNLSKNDTNLFVYLEATAGVNGYPGWSKPEMINTALVVQPNGYIVGTYGTNIFPVMMRNRSLLEWNLENSLIKKEIN